MTSQWRLYCFGGLDLSEAPLQESVAMATAKDPHSHFYLLTNSYIFSGKVTKFGWIIFLTLWVMGKKPKGGAEHIPPGQDRVKVYMCNQNWKQASYFQICTPLFLTSK